MCVAHGDREEPPIRRGRGRSPKQLGQRFYLSNLKKEVCIFSIFVLNRASNIQICKLISLTNYIIKINWIFFSYI